MKVQARSIDSIRPYPGNPRLNDDAVDAVAESIRRFGFRQPGSSSAGVDCPAVLSGHATPGRRRDAWAFKRDPDHVPPTTSTPNATCNAWRRS